MMFTLSLIETIALVFIGIKLGEAFTTNNQFAMTAWLVAGIQTLRLVVIKGVLYNYYKHKANKESHDKT